jgi:GNAT superfamily N-acetyltransferase
MEVIPFWREVSNADNVLVHVLDIDGLRQSAARAAAKGRLVEFNNDLTVLDRDLKTYLGNLNRGEAGEVGIGVAKRDRLNALMGIDTKRNKEANPLVAQAARGARINSAIKTLRMERIEVARPGNEGMVFDYDRANANLVPGDWRGDEAVNYRGAHNAPKGEFGEASLDAMDKTYPDDLYSENGARYYGDTVDVRMDRAMHALIRSLRGKPDAQVKVYRAVPKGATDKINPGDWVTPNRQYAIGHGERFDGGMDVIERTVRAGDLYTEGNSIFEFGWSPKDEAVKGAQPSRMADEAEAKLHQAEWDELKQKWETEGVIIEPSVRLRELNGTVRPNSVVVPQNMRGKGIGSKVMESMSELADKQGRRIALSPSTDFGGSSTERLKRFYSRFGFVRNKGRNKDFSISETMYRNPMGKQK